MIAGPLVTAAMLLGAGLVAGAMNAIAGGGTFVALPILTLAGLPPTAANASTTVALFPGTIASAWAYRKDVQPLEGASSGLLLALSLGGGLVGALLLLFTPQSAFSVIIPWLLLLATATLAAGPRAAPLLRRLGLHFTGRAVYFVQFILGIYGGYFGGAVGLMMLAAWSLATSAELRTLTPLRTVMVAAANGIAVVCFAVAGSVRWTETLTVMAGGIVGGYVGARLGWRMPPRLLRALILAVTIITTVVFFLRAYAR
jgi:uncharacterized membrane protein YfcA